MKWALVSEWLVEDPWQFVREVGGEGPAEWRDGEEGVLGRREVSPRDPTALATCVATRIFSHLLPKVFGLS